MTQPECHAMVRGWLFVVLLSLCACESEPTTSVTETVEVSGAVVGPEGIGAAVLAFSGAASVRVIGGSAYTRRTGATLQAVLVPNEPGSLEILVTPDDPAVAPTAVLLDLVNGEHRAPPSLGAYSVVFDS
jgi:hypothetical protein